jgi:Holliday junction resolvase RusA-like endonuclease
VADGGVMDSPQRYGVAYKITNTITGAAYIGIPVTITLLGTPVPWSRHQGGRSTKPFTPAKQRNNAATLRMAAQEEMFERLGDGVPESPWRMRPKAPFSVPVRLDVLAELEIPKTWSKRKQSAALAGDVQPGKRPDLSNVIKQIEDALNGVVFTDDALVVEIAARKVYGLQPKIVVTVSAA